MTEHSGAGLSRTPGGRIVPAPLPLPPPREDARLPGPGWYRSVAAGGRVRFWDGARWVDRPPIRPERGRPLRVLVLAADLLGTCLRRLR